MNPFRAVRARRLLAVVAVGMCMASVAVFGFVESRQQPCCAQQGLVPYASTYHNPLSRLDVVLTGGDGFAFTTLAQDPLLQRPQVMREPQEFAYRAQRPVWGYLDWVTSLGQARWTGWALVVLTVLSCGFACAVASVFLVERGRSPWWALIVPLAGFETITELTPELFSLALVGLGVLWWQRDRRAAAVIAFSVAALTRETMLVAIAALALYEVCHRAGPLAQRIRREVPLAIPFGVYGAWIVVLRVRLGNWPFFRSRDRLGPPLTGFFDAMHTEYASAIVFWGVIGVGLCVAAFVYARRDVLTWIALAFAAFATLLGPDVWVTNVGFERALLPMYVFGAIAAVSGIGARRDARVLRSVEPEHRSQEPAGVAFGRLGDVLR